MAENGPHSGRNAPSNTPAEQDELFGLWSEATQAGNHELAQKYLTLFLRGSGVAGAIVLGGLWLNS